MEGQGRHFIHRRLSELRSNHVAIGMIVAIVVNEKHCELTMSTYASLWGYYLYYRSLLRTSFAWFNGNGYCRAKFAWSARNSV